MDESTPPRAVSRFEANLLRILQCFVQRAPLAQALRLLLERHARPSCLSRAAVELVQDLLGKGTVLLLATAGWRSERHVRGTRVVNGRLWERTPPAELGVEFSEHTLEFLIWLTATNPIEDTPRWNAPETELTVGDRLLLFLAYEAVRDTDVAPALRSVRPIATHGLCRLAFPDDFVDNDKALPPADLLRWTTGPGAAILEALQRKLSDRWLTAERSKERITEWRRLLALGAVQDQVLNTLFGAVETAGRRDLARFLLEVAARLLAETVTTPAFSQLDLRRTRLADRSAVYRAALTLPRHLERLHEWERQARSVGYFDDGYAAAQLWLADWERYDGTTLTNRARELIQALDPLAAG